MSTMIAQAYQAASTYRKEQLLNLSPVEVIHKLYDVAILGCKKKDTVLAQRALNELIVGLNFDAGELSVGLYKLYDYCKRSIRSGNLSQAITVLEELRGAWAQAFRI